MLNKMKLEEVATALRKALEIDDNIILNSTNIEELTKKIEEKFEGFKIVNNYSESILVLENESNFTIYLNDNKDRFYDLVRMFTFAILLDRNAMNKYELQHSVFYFPRFSKNEGADEYLMLAFMMPKSAFISAVTKYSSGDGASVHIFEMQEKVNKYCYKRGIDLQMWS